MTVWNTTDMALEDTVTLLILFRLRQLLFTLVLDTSPLISAPEPPLCLAIYLSCFQRHSGLRRSMISNRLAHTREIVFSVESVARRWLLPVMLLGPRCIRRCARTHGSVGDQREQLVLAISPTTRNQMLVTGQYIAVEVVLVGEVQSRQHRR